MDAYWFSRLDGTTEHGGPYTVGQTVTMPRGTRLEMCRVGLHSSPTPWDALQYAQGPLLWLVAVPKRGTLRESDKFCSMRRKHIKAVDVTNVLHDLACRFAEDVLPLYEREHPGDLRPRQAIDTKRRWLRGEATDEELAAARAAMAAMDARDAAMAAMDAMAAAWAAARDAAMAAARAAMAAARAARDAAWGAMAAMAAAHAARAKYRQWGNDTLLAALNAPIGATT